MESKRLQSRGTATEIASKRKLIRCKIDLGATGFTRGFSKVKFITVGEQITAEKLIEKRKVMMISKAMIMNIGITFMSCRPKRFCIYYY